MFVFMRIVTLGFPNCLIQLDIYINASLVASDADSPMETVGENTFVDQKSHHRCRRKKHDCRMVDALR